jgi:MOSC domain-containing protein
MAVSEDIGTVAALWRFPVKSMGGEQLDSVKLTERGVLGDRAYGLIDKDTGRVASAKSVKHFPNVLDCKAAFVEEPATGRDLTPVQILLPDGTTVRSDSGDVDQVLSAYFKRNVTLERAAPDDFTIDSYHPERDTVVAQKLGSAFFAELGVDSPVLAGSFFDLFPLSVMTLSTLARLEEVGPQSHFDQRRFRMNVIVKTERTGFVENDWVGRALALGEAARINVTVPDPRCVMLTVAQDGLPKDTEILRTLASHNKVQVATLGQFPCAGVYAVVVAPGTVRIGDRVLGNSA